MPTMATRRTISSMRPTSARSVIKRSRRLSINGMTMSFDTMIASATDSTITIAVAADKPPTNAIRIRRSERAASGSASTYMSLSTSPAENVSMPASAIGTTKRLMSKRYSGNSHAARLTSRSSWFSTTVT